MNTNLYLDQTMNKAEKENNNHFGKRMLRIRKARGMTQTDLGKKVGMSKRVVCYYERFSKNPPAAKLHLIAKALKVSTDELLGLKNIKHQLSPENAALWRRLKKVENLSEKDQKALFHYIDALLHKSK